MRKYSSFILTAVAVVSFISCGESSKSGMSETDSLRVENKELRRQVDDYTMMLSVITESMDSLEASQSNLLSSGDREGTSKGPSKAQIEKKLSSFESLVARQRQRIAGLEALLADNKRHSASQIANLRGVIAMMQSQLDQKDAMIAELREQLSSRDLDIANLRTHITSLNTNIETLTTETAEMKKELENAGSNARECFVLVASKQELKKAGLLQGGGLFSKKKLDTDHINASLFHKYDMSQLSEITVGSAKPRILTSVPASSYRIHDNGDGTSKIVITDAGRFWSLSKYLIIQTK